ncbi:MAG: hypothetical protein ABW224_19960 [Kibdelosporangium sp.]
MESSNLRRAIVYGVAGLATAAIGATTVNSMVSEAEQPEAAQKTGQPAPATNTTPVVSPPAVSPSVPVPATQLQVRPATAAQQTKPAPPPAVRPAVKPTKKPVVKSAVQTRVKPMAKPKVKQVPVRKTAQVERKAITGVRVLPARMPKPVTVDSSLTKALAGVGQAQAAVKRAEAGLATAKKNLHQAKSELDKVRKRVTANGHRTVTTVTGAKVSKDVAKRLTHHKGGHVHVKPGQKLKISVSSSSSTG